MALFVALIMGIAAFAILTVQPVYAAGEDIDSGVYDGVPWRITSDYELIIGEKGQEYTFKGEEASYPWLSYSGSLKTATFEGTVYGRENMEDMFYGCSSLTNLDVTGFDTSNVTDMGGMFGECKSLTNLDIKNFNTSKVQYMDRMFESCSSLTELYLTRFDTSNVTNMHRMFAGCSSLTSLNLKNFNTSKVENMHGMFDGCSSLSSVDVSSFDTRNVGLMSEMFSECRSMVYLDVSNFDASEVSNMQGMFYKCNSLKTLSIGTDFNNANINAVCKATFPKTMYGSDETKYEAGAVIPCLGYSTTYTAGPDEPEDPCGGNHQWDSGMINKKATCTTDGMITYTCTRCGKTETRTIFASGHSWKHYKKAGALLKDGIEYYYCTDCNAKKNVKTLAGYASFYVKSLKVAKGKKCFTVKWAKQSATNQKKFNGYQIRYSLKSNMSSAKYATAGKASKSKTIKKLKAKKRYYVQVRTYTKKGGKIFYSKWSVKKSVKTK